MRIPVILAASLAAALVGSGSAAHCTDFSTSEPDLTVPGGFYTYYLDNDLCQPECLFSIWGYEETNGIEGLQRGDEVVDDTCHGMIEADTLSPY